MQQVRSLACYRDLSEPTGSLTHATEAVAKDDEPRASARSSGRMLERAGEGDRRGGDDEDDRRYEGDGIVGDDEFD